MGATESVFEDTTEPASTSSNAASVGQSRDPIPSRSRPNGVTKTMMKSQKRRPPSQAKPIKRMKGVVLGCPKTGKRTLLKRLEGIDPFTMINNNKTNDVENNKIDDDNDSINNSTAEPSSPSITIPYKPPVDSTTWDRIKLRIQYANNNFDDEKIQTKNKIDFVVILINPKHPRDMTQSHLTNVLHSYLDLLGHLTDNTTEKEKEEKMESSSSSNNNNETSSTTNITEPFCMVILFNFRDLQKEEGKDEISHPVVKDIESFVRETLRSRNVPEENIVLDLLDTSLRNCYGLDGLHRFIYRTYLQRCRADIEKQLNLVRNRIQITYLADTVLMKYDEFIEEITPKQIIEPQRAEQKQQSFRRSLKLQFNKQPQGQTSSARMGKEALEAFLASSSDEEDETPITKGTARSSTKKFGSAFSSNIDDDDDDDDDDIFYDESGNRRHNNNQIMTMGQMNGDSNDNEEEGNRSIQSSHSPSSEKIKLEESPIEITSKLNVPEKVETQQTSEEDDNANVEVEEGLNEVAKTKDITNDQKEIDITIVREEKEEIKIDAHETSQCSDKEQKEEEDISDNLQKMQVTKTGTDQEGAVDVDVDQSDDIDCENNHDDNDNDNDNDHNDDNDDEKALMISPQPVEQKLDDDDDDEGGGDYTTGSKHDNEAKEKNDTDDDNVAREKDDDDDKDDDFMISSTHANVAREEDDDKEEDDDFIISSTHANVAREKDDDDDEDDDFMISSTHANVAREKDDDDDDDDDFMISSTHANVAREKGDDDDDDDFMISSTPVQENLDEDDSDDDSGYMIQSNSPVTKNEKMAQSLSSTKIPSNNDSIEKTSSLNAAGHIDANKNSSSVSITQSDDNDEESPQKDENLTIQPSNSSLSAMNDKTAATKPVATSSGISAAALAAIAVAQQEAEAMMQQQQQQQPRNAASHVSPIKEKKSKKKKNEKDGEKKKKKKKKTKVDS